MPSNATQEKRALLKRHERGVGKTPVTKVGFYGCMGGVVRLEGTDYFPTNIRIKCPACHHEHIVRPFWRKKMDELDAMIAPQMVLVRKEEVPSADL